MRSTQAVGVHNITYFMLGHKYIITCINNNNSCTYLMFNVKLPAYIIMMV